MSTHCTFCDLIQGAAEVSVCYEDADAIAFMDIQPVNAGHVLVVPRQHLESLFDVPPDLGSHLFAITMRVANAVRRVTKCEGMNIVVNSGQAAGQDVFHYHVHIIPRRQGDGFDIQLPFGGSEMPDRTVLDMTAARIIAALSDPMKGEGKGGGGAADRRATSAQGAASRPAKPSMQADRVSVAAADAGERIVALPTHAEGLADVGSGSARLTQPRRLVEREGPHGELVRES